MKKLILLTVLLSALGGCDSGEVDHDALIADLQRGSQQVESLPESTVLEESARTDIADAVHSEADLLLLDNAIQEPAEEPDEKADGDDGTEGDKEGVDAGAGEQVIAAIPTPPFDVAAVDAINAILAKIDDHNRQIAQLNETVAADRADTAKLFRDVNQRVEDEVAARSEFAGAATFDQVAPHELVPPPLELQVEPAAQWAIDLERLTADFTQLAAEAKRYSEIIQLAKESRGDVAVLARDFPALRPVADNLLALANRTSTGPSGSAPRPNTPHTPKVHYLDGKSAVVSLQDGPKVRLQVGAEQHVSGVAMTLVESNPSSGAVVIHAAGHDHALAVGR